MIASPSETELLSGRMPPVHHEGKKENVLLNVWFDHWRELDPSEDEDMIQRLASCSVQHIFNKELAALMYQSLTKTATAPVIAPTLEHIFNGLAEKWKRETRNQSAISAIVMHPAYLDIIGIGPKVIPFILRDLKKETNHWFTALRALAKMSPINPEDAGNLKKMRDAWLRWGKENGHLD